MIPEVFHQNEETFTTVQELAGTNNFKILYNIETSKKGTAKNW